MAILPFLGYCIAACTASTTEAVPLELTLTANRSTVAPGDTVAFSVQARGSALVGVEIDYGDSVKDGYSTGGAFTARVSFRHSYGASGTYVVRAVITDAREGEKDATVEVRVN